MRVEQPEQAEGAAERPGESMREATAADLIGASTPGELDLFPVVMLLRSHLGRTLMLAILGLLIAAGYTYTRKPRYSSTATILIPQGGQSEGNDLLRAATGLDLLGGGYEVYLDILHSRTVRDRLIQKYNLIQHYRAGNLDGAEDGLGSRTRMYAAKDGFIMVIVQDEDPKLAAMIANDYFTELSTLNARLGITAASQLRRYYEGEMIKEKNALSDAEVALEQSQQRNGILEPQVKAGAALGAEENVRAQLRARQVELQGLLQGATESNPEVVRLRAVIGGLEGQLNAIEQTGGLAAGTPASRQPAQALDYIRKQREVRFHETLMDLLTRQYETARQQESKEISLIEALDAARPSTYSEWPPKNSWLTFGFVAGFIVGVLWTVVEAFGSLILRNPLNRQRLQTLASGRSPRVEL